MKYGLLVIASLILLIGGFFAYQYRTKETIPSTLPKDENEVMMQKDSKTTLKDLFLQNTQAECTFRHEDEGSIVSGVVYLDGERMRGTFTMNDSEFGNIDGSVIRDGSYAYAWGGPLGDSGTKVKISDSDNEKSNELLDYEQDVAIDCKDWNVDESFFTPPAEINFQDISSAVEEIGATTNSIKELQCSACDAIPEAADREQCRVALQC